MKKLFIILALGIPLFLACNEPEDTDDDPAQQLVFHSLEADTYTLVPGESAHIVANAEGYRITYYWWATAGDLIVAGAANEASYIPSPCHVGENRISCQVRDGNNQSLTKTITIVVE